MKKLFIILILIFSTFQINAQNLFGVYGAIGGATQPNYDASMGLQRAKVMGVECFLFSFEMYFDNMDEYSSSHSTLHYYPDIIERNKTYGTPSSGVEGWAIYINPPLPTGPIEFYFGVGFYKTYDIIEYSEHYVHKYRPYNTYASGFRKENELKEMAFNLQIRFDIAEITQDYFGISLSPMITFSSCEKVMTTFGLAFDIGLNQSRLYKHNLFQKSAVRKYKRENNM